MDGDCQKPHKIIISDFYKLHMNKGKEYTLENFKKFDIHKATIYGWMKKIEQNGNWDRKPKMFDHLKGRVHVANQNGLQSLLKF